MEQLAYLAAIVLQQALLEDGVPAALAVVALLYPVMPDQEEMDTVAPAPAVVAVL